MRGASVLQHQRPRTSFALRCRISQSAVCFPFPPLFLFKHRVTSYVRQYVRAYVYSFILIWSSISHPQVPLHLIAFICLSVNVNRITRDRQRLRIRTHLHTKICCCCCLSSSTQTRELRLYQCKPVFLLVQLDGHLPGRLTTNSRLHL